MSQLKQGDFDNRITVEKDLNRLWKPQKPEWELKSQSFIAPSIGFDESDKFVYFASPLGIKVLNLET